MKSSGALALFLLAASVGAEHLRAGRKLACGTPTLGAPAQGATFGGGFIQNVTISTTPKSTPAEYRVVFTNTWTSTSHPPDYPSNAHWSAPFGGTHDCNYEMWSAGELASEGVVDVAETGGIGALSDELSAEQDKGTVFNIFNGRNQFRLDQNPTQEFTLSISEDHPLISLVTMIAPSPDWFAGVHDLEPTSQGFWWDSFAVDLNPYDSGSDGGVTYRAGNVPLEPRVEIQRITAGSFPTTEVFVKDGGVLPVARLSFELIA